jgi:hypothetical protein
VAQIAQTVYELQPDVWDELARRYPQVWLGLTMGCVAPSTLVHLLAGREASKEERPNE